MRGAALSLAGVRLDAADHYREDLRKILKKMAPRLAVLPAYSSLMLWAGCRGSLDPVSFAGIIQEIIPELSDWNECFYSLHSSLATELGIYLVAGTTLEREGENLYHTACCFNPKGELCAKQRQTHLTREERELGYKRGVELELIKSEQFKAGLIVGIDARHPETGRILALKGADIFVHTGALEENSSTGQQLAGMWAQVQQNQCWAVEAQLSGIIGDKHFGAGCQIIGPCEVTEDLSGYLGRADAGEPAVAANLEERARLKAKQGFPVLRQLNPTAYEGLLKADDS